MGHVDCPDGLRLLAEKLKRRESFRDLALPVILGANSAGGKSPPARAMTSAARS